MRGVIGYPSHLIRGTVLSIQFVTYTVPMRIMALDIGDARVGIAVSDPAGRVASPVCVLPAQDVRAGARAFRKVLEDWEPELFVCGLPRTLSGDEGPQAAHVRAFAQSVSDMCSIPLEFADERLSSVEAKRSLRESGMSEKGMRGKVDMIAASIFLQAWLDGQPALNDKAAERPDAAMSAATGSEPSEKLR